MTSSSIHFIALTLTPVLGEPVEPPVPPKDPSTSSGRTGIGMRPFVVSQVECTHLSVLPHQGGSPHHPRIVSQMASNQPELFM